jgi:hypothetical protein
MAQNEKLESFEREWRGRIAEIKESEFSPKSCHNIYGDFTRDIEAIVTDVSIDFGESEPVLRSIRADLTIALEQAKSNYRKSLDSPWEQMKFSIENIEVKILSLF